MKQILLYYSEADMYIFNTGMEGTLNEAKKKYILGKQEKEEKWIHHEKALRLKTKGISHAPAKLHVARPEESLPDEWQAGVRTGETSPTFFIQEFLNLV